MISDEECRDTMIYDVFSFLKKKSYSIGDLLEENEKDLFEEYAPRLFNSYTKGSKLKEDMLKLVELYIDYTFNKANPKKGAISPRQFKQEVYNQSPIPNKNKSYEYQVEELKKHLEYVYNYLGGKCYNTKYSKDFKEQLLEVCNNPKKYLPKRPTIKSSKKPIKDFLISLKLNGKTIEINNFIKAIT